jgi:hypothetical protein
LQFVGFIGIKFNALDLFQKWTLNFNLIVIKEYW